MRVTWTSENQDRVIVHTQIRFKARQYYLRMVFSQEGSVVTMNKRTNFKNVFRKYYEFNHLFNPLRSSVVKEAQLTKIMILRKKRWLEKVHLSAANMSRDTIGANFRLSLENWRKTEFLIQRFNIGGLKKGNFRQGKNKIWTINWILRKSSQRASDFWNAVIRTWGHMHQNIVCFWNGCSNFVGCAVWSEYYATENKWIRSTNKI